MRDYGKQKMTIDQTPFHADIPFDDFTNLSGIAEDGDGWRSIDRGGMINKTMKAKQHA